MRFCAKRNELQITLLAEFTLASHMLGFLATLKSSYERPIRAQRSRAAVCNNCVFCGALKLYATDPVIILASCWQ